MTQQAIDRIVYEGRDRPLAERPLDFHEDADALRKRFVTQSTSNWRGHTAEWAVQNGWLYLTRINGLLSVNGETREAQLSDIRPGHEPLVASWFTGVLNLGDGRRIESDADYGPVVHERTIRLTFQAGQVQSVEVVQNSEPSESTSWPQRQWFPLTEEGHNEYMDRWSARQRSAPLISSIPVTAIEDRRAAVALAKTNGWRDMDGEGQS